MFKGLGNLASLMRQAQDIGGKMGDIAETLKNQRVTGSAGGDMVVVEANGLSEVLKVTVDPMLIEQNEQEMLQDLLPAAINQAIKASKQLHMEAMRDLTGGVSLPGLDDALNSMMGQLEGEDLDEQDDHHSPPSENR